MLTVAGTSVAIKIIAVMKGLVLAQQFGVSADLDAFYIAYLLPSFLGDLLAGAIVIALVPLYIRTKDQDGTIAAQTFIGNILVVTTICSIVVAVLGWALLPTLIWMFGESFQQDRLELASRLSLFLIPVLPLSAISAIFISVLTARNRLGVATLAPGISILVVTVAIYGFGREWGIYSLGVGTTLGLIVQTLTLAMILKVRDFLYRVSLRWLTGPIRSFSRQIMIVAAGGFIINFIDVIDQYSAGILGPGHLSVLNYGNKFALAVLGPASVAVSTAIFPHMSGLVYSGDFAAARRIVKTYSIAILGVTIPVTLLLVVWSRTIVMMLFERNAFTSYDTLQVTAVQRFFLLQIPLHVLGMLFVSVIWSLRVNWVFLLINPTCLLLKIWLNHFLTAVYGVPGIGLATSITYGVSCLLLLIATTWLMRREEVHCTVVLEKLASRTHQTMESPRPGPNELGANTGTEFDPFSSDSVFYHRARKIP